MEEIRKKICCCLPGFNFSSPWVSNWTSLLCSLRDKMDVQVVFGYSNNIYITRNCLFQNIVESGQEFDYVLWMDDDNILTPEQFAQLLDDLERNPRVSGVLGWYWQQPQGRQLEPTPSVGDMSEDGIKFLTFHPKRMYLEPVLEKCDGGGFGAFLIRWDELMKVGGNCFSPIILKESLWGFAGDDISFFIRAKELGMEFVVDKRIQVPHMKLRDASFDPLQFLDMPAEVVPALNIQGWMDHNELKWLFAKASKMKSVVEIGSWRGRSSTALLAGCKGLVNCVDTWQGATDSIQGENKSLADVAKQEDIFGDFLKNVGHFSNLRIMKIDSLSAAPYIEQADMIFIDASHEFDDVVKDIEAWQPKAKKLLCGHDVNRPEVKAALESKGIEFQRGPGSIWFLEIVGEKEEAYEDRQLVLEEV